MSIKSQYPQLNDRDWLYQRYVIERRSAVEIAEIVDCHPGAVTRALKRFDIPTVRRGPGRYTYPQLQDPVWLAAAIETKTIREIATEVGCTNSAVKHALVRFGITVPHRSHHHAYVDKSAISRAAYYNTYPEGRKGSQSGNWRGGRLIRGGYVILHRDLVAERWPNHPRLALPGWTHKQEHVLVMEDHLGRCLEPGEEVHHGPGGKQDNRLENLTRMGSRGEHQTAEWAKAKHANWLHEENLNLKRFIVHKGISLDEYYAWKDERVKVAR